MAVGVLKPPGNKIPQLVHIKLRGIDHYVCQLANRRHQFAFVQETLAHGIIFSERMRPARFAVPAQQRVVLRFNEHQRNWMVFAQVRQKPGQLLQLRALARVHQQRRAAEIAFSRRMQFGKNGDQFYRHVVHAVEAHIFKRFQYRAFAGAGKPGQDYQLFRILFCSGFYFQGGAQLFTRRWWVLGIRMSSRYLATVRRVTWMPASSSFCAMCSSVSGFVESSS